MGEQNDDAQGGSSASAAEKIVVEMDGKQVEVTADSAKALLSQQAAATQASQKAAAVFKVAEKYGLDVADFATNAEAVFGLVQDLVDRGVIDEKGQLVEKKEAVGGKAPIAPTIPQQAGVHADAAIQQALVSLQKQNELVVNELARLRQDNVGLIRLQVQGEIKQKYPTLDQDDISRVLAAASNSKDKSVFELAEDLAGRKAAYLKQMREQHAKEFGINLEEHERNRTILQDGRGASGMAEGKKFSFNKGKGNTTPKEAMRMFMNAQRNF